METQIGTPIKPMLVSESGASDGKFGEIIKNHGGETLVETKYDGFRIQIHKEGDIQLFTRGLNPLNPNVFPELFSQFATLPDGIYDGELAGTTGGIKGFNAVKKRVRKDLDPKLVDQFPLEIRYFDVLHIEDKSLINWPLYKRRQALEQCASNISSQMTIEDPEELQEEYQRTIGLGLEGLVCKDKASLYLPGGRTKDWTKLKEFLTLDLAVLGVYQGNGKAASKEFAAVLLGAKNGNHYETLTKVAFPNKEMTTDLYNLIKDGYTNSPPKNVVISDAINKKTYAKKVPTHYIDPKQTAVVEVKVMDITRSKNWHSCGLEDKAYSARIPVVQGIRKDKKLKDCTTTAQIAEIYNSKNR
jgi:ATP-dependent DNA ligase I